MKTSPLCIKKTCSVFIAKQFQAAPEGEVKKISFIRIDDVITGISHQVYIHGGYKIVACIKAIMLAVGIMACDHRIARVQPEFFIFDFKVVIEAISQANIKS